MAIRIKGYLPYLKDIFPYIEMATPQRFMYYPNGNMIRYVTIDGVHYEISVPVEKWTTQVSSATTYWIRQKKNGKSPEYKYGLVNIIDTIPDSHSRYRCDSCTKLYKSYSGFYKHRPKCSGKCHDDVSDTTIQPVETTQPTDSNPRTIVNQNTNDLRQSNITNNNQFNIQIRDFGKENPRWLTASLIAQVIRDIPTAIPQLMKHKHFNSNFPENHNIRVDTKREVNNHLQVHQDGRWRLYRTKPLFFKMMDSIHDIISDALNEDDDDIAEENEELDTEEERTHTYRQIQRFRNDRRFLEKIRRIRPIWRQFNDELQEYDRKHINEMWEDLKVLILDRQLALEQGFDS